MANVGNIPSGGDSPSGHNSPTLQNSPGGGSNIPSAAMPASAIWFKGDAGVSTSGSNVTAWADQSGGGHNVTSNGGTNPQLSSSVINGIPGITYTATTQWLSNTSTSVISPGAARHVFVVCKPGAAVSGAVFSTGGGVLFSFGRSSTTWGLLAGVLSGTTYGYSDAAASASLVSPPTIINNAIVVEQSSPGPGSLASFAVNGTAYTLTGQVVVSESGTAGFTVGNFDFSSTQVFSGSICEVIVYDHVLSGNQLTAVRQYFQGKYAINLGV